MNKKIMLQKNTIFLFFLNILVLITLIAFKMIFSKIGYSILWVNLMFIINIITLIIGIIFNIVLVINPTRYSVKKSVVVMLSCFIIYLLLNIMGTYVINKTIIKKYSLVSNKLIVYCKSYSCDRYETKKEGKYLDFIIKNTYYDYNNNKQYFEIHNFCDTNNVKSVDAIIYSDNNSFSQELIKDLIYDYFINFGAHIDAVKIKEAFDKRFDDFIVTDDELSYRVSEIYENNKLTGLKTEIKYSMLN